MDNDSKKLKICGQANLPTKYGHFKIFSFSNESGEILDDLAILRYENSLKNKNSANVRIHSECVTGEVFGSLRCDCREQLDLSFKKLFDNKLDLILYLRQEGRGIGAGNKIRVYELQDQGYDTVQANVKLGFVDDARDYHIASLMLKSLSINSVNLFTNNPRKVDGLRKYGIHIVSRIPIVVHPTQNNIKYLDTKRKKMGHML